MATFQDALTGSTLNTSLWTEFTASGGTTTYTSVGASMNYPNPTNTSCDADISSVGTYDLTGSFARVCVTNVPQGANSDATFKLRAGSNTNDVHWQNEGTNLFAAYIITGTQTILATLTYNATTHAWWQIREKGGTTYWETSSDGVNWTTRASTANKITLTSLTANLAATSFGTDNGLAPFTFRYFNYPQPGTTTSTSSTSVSSTSSSTSSTSTSISSTSSSTSSTSTSMSTSSTSTSVSSTSSSTSSTSSSTSSTSTSSTSSSTSVSSTSSSISSTSTSSTSTSSTSSSTSVSSTSSSFSSTSSSISSTSASTSSTSVSTSSTSSSTSTSTVPPPYYTFSYKDSSINPGTTANLNAFNSIQYQNETGDDGDYFITRGSKYLVQEYKNVHQNNTDAPSFIWKGRSTVSCAISPMYLQIFNQVTTNPTVIYLTSTGANAWNVPNNFTSLNNTIEVIGGGGGGSNHAGTGGGGGAYAKIFNFGAVPGASINYTVGLGGAGGAAGADSAGTNGGDTFFNSLSFAAASVAAKGGTGGPNGASLYGNGGKDYSSIGTTVYSGGNGGNSAGAGSGLGAGGGAGGPNGPGKSGGNEGASGQNAGSGGGGGGGGYPGAVGGATTGGNGGNNYLNANGGAGSSSTASPGTDGIAGGGGGGGATNAGQTLGSAGGNGGPGTEWDSTHGSGGGGGSAGSTGLAAIVAPNGGGGGNYGGGGGSSGTPDVAGDDGKGGDGAQGIIVITYYPAWETLAINNQTPADTDFILKGTQTTNLSNYYDSTNTVTFRSYQLVI